MPIYEYECTKCGEVEEAFQRFSDKPLSRCRHCSGKLQRLISHSTFHLKGSGWYVTDYASKSKNPSSNKPSKTESATSETSASSDSTGQSKDSASKAS
jgi:putative FmdB family regulatory protein